MRKIVRGVSNNSRNIVSKRESCTSRSRRRLRCMSRRVSASWRPSTIWLPTRSGACMKSLTLKAAMIETRCFALFGRRFFAWSSFASSSSTTRRKRWSRGSSRGKRVLASWGTSVSRPHRQRMAKPLEYDPSTISHSKTRKMCRGAVLSRPPRDAP